MILKIYGEPKTAAMNQNIANQTYGLLAMRSPCFGMDTMLYIPDKRPNSDNIIESFQLIRSSNRIVVSLEKYGSVILNDKKICNKYNEEYSISRQIFELYKEELEFNFRFMIHFNQDPDTPLDEPKYLTKSMLIDQDTEKKPMDISKLVSDSSYSSYRGYSQFYTEKNLIGICSDYVYNPHPEFISDLITILSRYIDLRISADILQTEFRVNDLMDNSSQEFDLCIVEKFIPRNESDKAKKIYHTIKEEKLQKAIMKLTGWQFPTAESDCHVFEPIVFKWYGTKFRFVPIPCNPMRGFLMKKSYFKNRDLFLNQNLIDCVITIYDEKTLEEKAVFMRYSTCYTDMDILSEIQTMLDILSIKYNGMARAVFNINFENLKSRSIIIQDSFHKEFTGSYYALERAFEMLLG